jgi:hypothetical protein
MDTPNLPTDELFQVELRIAQRADELARNLGSDREHALEHWRRAEREVWQARAVPAVDEEEIGSGVGSLSA